MIRAWAAGNGVFQPLLHGVCYAPLYIFAGGICWQQLRPSNVDPAAGALDELRRILPQIRQRWPQVRLSCGDSATLATTS